MRVYSQLRASVYLPGRFFQLSFFGQSLLFLELGPLSVTQGFERLYFGMGVQQFMFASGNLLFGMEETPLLFRMCHAASG